jgi:hypothetical protein
MRNLTLGLAVLLASSAAQAQQAAQPKMVCHTLASTGFFIAADETYVDGNACKAVVEKPAVQTVSEAVAPEGHQAVAQVYFYRPNKFEGSSTRPLVLVDDVRVARLRSGESLSYFVTPGRHQISSADKSSTIVVDAKPGQTYYVRFDVEGGFLKERAGLKLVAPQAPLVAGQSGHQNAGGN